MDFDCGEDKAAKGKGYATIDETEAEIRQFCQDTAIPHPTFIIESGGGLHVYWVLDESLTKERWLEYARKLKAIAKSWGLLADPSRTADIASVLRIPGTLNHKYDPPRSVVLRYASDRFIDTSAMLKAIDLAHSETGNTLPSKSRSSQTRQATGQNTAQNCPPNMDRLASALKPLDPDCDETTWKLKRIAILARLARAFPKLADALYQLARSWSSGELRSEPSKAWTTPGNSNGKTGEEILDEVWNRFFNDNYNGNLTTLGTIYHDALGAGWVDPDAFQLVSSPEVVTEKDEDMGAQAFIQKRYALINVDGRIWVQDLRSLTPQHGKGSAMKLVLSKRSDGNLLIIRAIREKYPDVDPGEIARDFFGSPDTTCYTGIEFNPVGTTEGHLNLWQGPTIIPKAGDWTLIRLFLLNAICDGDQKAYDYLIRYIAHALQFPGVKPGVMIILLGGQGTGKGTLGRILHLIWDATYLQVHNIDAVTGNFNASLEGVLWVFLDEALFVGDRRSSDSLKSLVTEPVIHIHQKHQPARQIRSYHRFVAASNSEHFKHTEKDERRDFVLRVSEDRKGDHAYWQALYTEIDNSDVEAMVYDLQKMDLSDFNVRDKPQTQELIAQKLHSLEPIHRWWYECLFNGEITEGEGWPDFIGTTEAIEGVVNTAGGKFHRKPSASDLVSTMSKLCPSARKKQLAKKNSRKRGIELPSLEQARAEFEDFFGGSLTW